MVFSTWGWVRRHLCIYLLQMTKLRNSRGGPFVSSISAVASVTTVTTGQCPQPPRWRNKPVQRSDDNSARPQRRNDRLFCAFRDNKYHSRGAEQGSRHRATDRGRLRQCCRQYCAYLLQLAAAASCCLNNQLLRAHDFYKTRIDILRLEQLCIVSGSPSACTISRWHLVKILLGLKYFSLTGCFLNSSQVKKYNITAHQDISKFKVPPTNSDVLFLVFFIQFLLTCLYIGTFLFSDRIKKTSNI